MLGLCLTDLLKLWILNKVCRLLEKQMLWWVMAKSKKRIIYINFQILPSKTTKVNINLIQKTVKNPGRPAIK